MRKPLIIVLSVGALGAASWLLSSTDVEQVAMTSGVVSPAAVAPPRPASPIPSPATAPSETSAEVVETSPAEPELDADGDHHHDQPAELRALAEPPVAAQSDPDPAAGEAAALGEARSMLQTLAAETNDPAAREQAEAMLEAIDARSR